MLNPAPAHFDPDPPASSCRCRPGSASPASGPDRLPWTSPARTGGKAGFPVPGRASRRRTRSAGASGGRPARHRKVSGQRGGAGGASRGFGRTPRRCALRRKFDRDPEKEAGMRRGRNAGWVRAFVPGESCRAPARQGEGGVLPVTTGHALLAAGDHDSHDSRLVLLRSEVDDLRFLVERYFPGPRARAGRLRRNGWWSPRGEGFVSEIPSFFG